MGTNAVMRRAPIIGCDFHPGFQQVAISDNRTGAIQESGCSTAGKRNSLMAVLGRTVAETRTIFLTFRKSTFSAYSFGHNGSNWTRAVFSRLVCWPAMTKPFSSAYLNVTRHRESAELEVKWGGVS